MNTLSRADRQRILYNIHTAWALANVDGVTDEFEPRGKDSDYNVHNVDIDASGEMEDEFADLLDAALAAYAGDGSDDATAKDAEKPAAKPEVAAHLFTCIDPAHVGLCTAARKPRVIKDPEFEEKHFRGPGGMFADKDGIPNPPRKTAKKVAAKAAPKAPVKKATPRKKTAETGNLDILLPLNMVPEPTHRGGRVWTRRGPGTYVGPDAQPDAGRAVYWVDLDDGGSGMMSASSIETLNPEGDGPAENGDAWRNGSPVVPFPAKKAAAPRKAAAPKKPKATPAEVTDAFQAVKAGNLAADELQPQLTALTSAQLDQVAGDLEFEGWKPRATKAAKVASIMQVARGVENANAVMGRNKSESVPFVSGKDLSADLDLKKLRPLLGKKNPRGTREDLAMAAIAKAQGFDGPPKVGTPSEIDAAIAGGAKELFRMVSDATDARTGKTIPAAAVMKQLRYGPAHYSLGLSGSGIYTGEWEPALRRYMREGRGSAMTRMALHPDAKVLNEMWDGEREHAEDLGELAQEATRIQVRLFHGLNDAITAEDREKAYADYQRAKKVLDDRTAVYADIGRWAAAKGYDAIEAPRADGSYWVILNRTALMIENGERNAA